MFKEMAELLPLGEQEIIERWPDIETGHPQSVGEFATWLTYYFADTRTDSNPLQGDTWVPWEIRRIVDKAYNLSDSKERKLKGYGWIVEKVMQDVEHETEQGRIKEFIEESTVEEGQVAIYGFLDRFDYAFELEFAPSPLFPQGRKARMSIEEARRGGYIGLPYSQRGGFINPEGMYLDGRLMGFLQKVPESDKATLGGEAVLASIEEVGVEELEELRKK